MIGIFVIIEAIATDIIVFTI